MCSVEFSKFGSKEFDAQGSQGFTLCLSELLNGCKVFLVSAHKSEVKVYLFYHEIYAITILSMLVGFW